MRDDTAIRLERRFKMPARFWLHLQAHYDLQMALNKARAADVVGSGWVAEALLGHDDGARPASGFSRLPCLPRRLRPARNRLNCAVAA